MHGTDECPVNNNNNKNYTTYKFKPQTYMRGTLLLIVVIIVILVLLYSFFTYRISNQ